MDWMRLLAYITEAIDQEHLLRGEYLATENRILKAQFKSSLLLSNTDKTTLGEVGHEVVSVYLRTIIPSSGSCRVIDFVTLNYRE